MSPAVASRSFCHPPTSRGPSCHPPAAPWALSSLGACGPSSVVYFGVGRAPQATAKHRVAGLQRSPGVGSLDRARAVFTPALQPTQIRPLCRPLGGPPRAVKDSQWYPQAVKDPRRSPTGSKGLSGPPRALKDSQRSPRALKDSQWYPRALKDSAVPKGSE